MWAREYDHHGADRRILDASPTEPGWEQRAVGKPMSEALVNLPVVGRFETQIPIVPFGRLQAHMRRMKVNQARYVREAIVDKYLREGGDPAVAQAALDMARMPYQYKDVPRDHGGQHRRRKGRNSQFWG